MDRVPSSWGVSPSCMRHLGAVAARLAGWQVCGTEPSAEGAAGLELRRRCAAVLRRERQAGWWGAARRHPPLPKPREHSA